jgi:hypothetical protein
VKYLRDALLHLGQLGILAVALWLGPILGDKLKWPTLLTEAIVTIVTLFLTEALIDLVFARPTVMVDFFTPGNTYALERVEIPTDAWRGTTPILEMKVQVRRHSLLGRYALNKTAANGLDILIHSREAPIRFAVDFSAPADEPDRRKKIVREDPPGELRIVCTSSPPRDTWVFARVAWWTDRPMTSTAFSVMVSSNPVSTLPLRLERLIKVQTSCKRLIIHRQET